MRKSTCIRPLVWLCLGGVEFVAAPASAQEAAPSSPNEPPDVVVETAPPPPPAVQTPSPLGRGVFVHIDSPRPVNLQLRDDDRRHLFRSICTSPCDSYVPANGQFRIGGDALLEDNSEEGLRSFDVRASHRFALLGGVAAEVIHVRPRSQTAFGGGVVLAALGGVALGVAAIWFLSNGFAETDSARPNMTGPIVTAGAGFAAIVSGLLLVGLNSSTSVSQSRR